MLFYFDESESELDFKQSFCIGGIQQGLWTGGRGSTIRAVQGKHAKDYWTQWQVCQRRSHL